MRSVENSGRLCRTSVSEPKLLPKLLQLAEQSCRQAQHKPMLERAERQLELGGVSATMQNQLGYSHTPPRGQRLQSVMKRGRSHWALLTGRRYLKVVLVIDMVVTIPSFGGKMANVLMRLVC